MMQKANIAVVNSLIFLSGSLDVEVPEVDGIARIWANDSCIAIATYPEQDGATDVFLGTAAETGISRPPDFEGYIVTPDGEILISDVVADVVMQTPVPSRNTRIQIWLSHPVWPEEIRISYA